MIITCENCESSFRVPKDAIGENGRLVKCSSCDHEWLVKPEAPKDDSEDKKPDAQVEEGVKSEDAPAEEGETETVAKESAEDEKAKPQNKESGKSEPKKKPPKRFVAPPEPIHKRSLYRYAVYGSFAAMLLLALAQVFINSLYTLSTKSTLIDKAYQLIGMYDTAGLVLEKVDCTINEIRSSKNLGNDIEVEVDAYIKNTTEVMKTLKYIRFELFDEHRDFMGDLVMEVDKHILPNESYHIEGVLNRVPKDSYYVSIDYGNYAELIYKSMSKLHP